MASVISEDVDDLPDIHPIRLEAKKLAEGYGYIVKVLEEMGVGTGDVAMGPAAGPAAPAPVKPRTKPRPGEQPGKRREKRRGPFNPPRPAKDPKPKACSMRESRRIAEAGPMGGTHPGSENEQGYEMLGQTGDGRYKGIIINRPTRGTMGILRSMPYFGDPSRKMKGAKGLEGSMPEMYFPLPVILKNGKPWLAHNGDEWLSAQTDRPVNFSGDKAELFGRLCDELGLSEYCGQSSSPQSPLRQSEIDQAGEEGRGPMFSFPVGE
jgi:hypothetical protein